jgi:cobalt-zinc-cadmium efflux system protein
MGHEGHSEGHSHAPKDFGKAFLWGIALNSGFIALEVFFGLWSDSLALLADAGHNLADVLGLVLAWVATLLIKKTATERRTYGWRRSTILAALFNAVLLLVGVGGIVWEAIGRLSDPAPVSGPVVAWVAAAGILVNGFTAWLFLSGRKDDLNVRGAFLHMAADAGVSLGVMVSGIVIFFTGWVILDPVVSFVIAGLILWSTWGLFFESLDLSLDAVPAGIDPAAVRAYLEALPEIQRVHHLHIWPLGTTQTALTVHLVKRDSFLDNDLLARIEEDMEHQFHIGHVTIQLEAPRAGKEMGSTL